MEAATTLQQLMLAIDERRWSDLGQFLHRDFVCRYVHTGESFDRDQWVRLNAEYPGFDRLHVREVVGDAQAAACRSHVTGTAGGGLHHFACATFAQVEGGLIREMTEVWTDVKQSAPQGTRPSDLSVDPSPVVADNADRSTTTGL